mmetsp:Transcript_23714/g.49642  ORF Transcript_23714/g.49642 Transcript_23714/m.49642 type:complete len:205 (-) Transcript_23714:703-1317(-)
MLSGTISSLGTSMEASIDRRVSIASDFSSSFDSTSQCSSSSSPIIPSSSTVACSTSTTGEVGISSPSESSEMTVTVSAAVVATPSSSLNVRLISAASDSNGSTSIPFTSFSLIPTVTPMLSRTTSSLGTSMEASIDKWVSVSPDSSSSIDSIISSSTRVDCSSSATGEVGISIDVGASSLASLWSSASSISGDGASNSSRSSEI